MISKTIARLLALACLMTGVPALAQIDASVQRGYQLITQSATRLSGAGNGLNCSSCHLDGGTKINAAPWTGLASAFPAYSARKGAQIDLLDRVNECMQRSLNRKPLARDSKEMHDILSYIGWLSTTPQHSHDQRGFVSIDRSLVPDPANGKRVFANHCASCHGSDGAGIKSDVGYRIPPLWGAHSFTDGAGMARRYTAAAFIKFNMPLGEKNTLTEQEAVDVAQFFTHQDRPAFDGKSVDWPNGNKPVDARN